MGWVAFCWRELVNSRTTSWKRQKMMRRSKKMESDRDPTQLDHIWYMVGLRYEDLILINVYPSITCFHLSLTRATSASLYASFTCHVIYIYFRLNKSNVINLRDLKTCVDDNLPTKHKHYCLLVLHWYLSPVKFT